MYAINCFAPIRRRCRRLSGILLVRSKPEVPCCSSQVACKSPMFLVRGKPEARVRKYVLTRPAFRKGEQEKTTVRAGAALCVPADGFVFFYPFPLPVHSRFRLPGNYFHTVRRRLACACRNKTGFLPRISFLLYRKNCILSLRIYICKLRIQFICRTSPVSPCI